MEGKVALSREPQNTRLCGVLRALRSYASQLIRNVASTVIIFHLIAGFVMYNVI